MASLTVSVTAMSGRGAATVTVAAVDVITATLYRSIDGGAWSAVRGAVERNCSAGGFVVIDTEYPFGVPIRYQANSVNPPDVQSAAVTYEDPGDPCRMNVMDPVVPVLGAWFDVTERQDLTAEARVSVVAIVGRREPVAVSDVRGGYVGSTTIFCHGFDQVTQVRNLIRPGRPLVLRYPAGWDEPIVYAAVGDVVYSRISHTGSDGRRLVEMPWTEVAEPRGDIQQYLGPTYQTVKDYDPIDGAFPLTYQGVRDHNADYLELIVEGPDW